MASSTILRLSRTATGALAHDLLGEADGAVERLARLDEPVDEAVVVGPLGGDGVAGEGQLHGDVERAACGPGGTARRRRRPATASPRGCRTWRWSEATTRSHASTISVPPARAGPSTAAISGLVALALAMPPKPPRAVARPPALPALISLRSAPAQNTGGSPGEDADPDLVVGLDLVDRRLDALGRRRRSRRCGPRGG